MSVCVEERFRRHNEIFISHALIFDSSQNLIPRVVNVVLIRCERARSQALEIAICGGQIRILYGREQSSQYESTHATKNINFAGNCERKFLDISLSESERRGELRGGVGIACCPRYRDCQSSGAYNVGAGRLLQSVCSGARDNLETVSKNF